VNAFTPVGKASTSIAYAAVRDRSSNRTALIEGLLTHNGLLCRSQGYKDSQPLYRARWLAVLQLFKARLEAAVGGAEIVRAWKLKEAAAGNHEELTPSKNSKKSMSKK
jgi:hypothetical protein